MRNITNKEKKTLGFLKRNLKQCSSYTKEKACKALARPTVEYSSSAWDCYTGKNIVQVEMVQRRAARWVLSRYKDEDSIVKQALQISIDLHHNGKTSFYSNLMKMVDYYDLNYDFSCNSLSDSIVNRYIGIMKNKYVSYWNQTLQQSQKLSFYCTIKDDYSPSPYLVLTRKNPSRKTLFTI